MKILQVSVGHRVLSQLVTLARFRSPDVSYQHVLMIRLNMSQAGTDNEVIAA